MMPCDCLMAVLPWKSLWVVCVTESPKSLENKKEIQMRPLGLDFHFIRSASPGSGGKGG
jgi:hypothetical protein